MNLLHKKSFMNNVLFSIFACVLLASCGGGGNSSGSSTPTTETPVIEEAKNYLHTVEELTEYNEDGTNFVTKTYYEYDELGNVLNKKVDQDNDGTFEYTDIYYRSIDGDIFHEEHYVGDDLVDMTEYYHDEDSNGNQIVEIEAMYGKTKKVFDENGNVVEESYYPFDMVNMEYVTTFENKYVYEYDSSNNYTKSTEYINGQSSPENIYYSNGTADYGADGTLNRVPFYDDTLEEGIGGYEIKTSWNDDRTQKTEQKVWYNGSISVTKTTYDSLNRIILEEYDSENDGVLETSTKYSGFKEVQ